MQPITFLICIMLFNWRFLPSKLLKSINTLSSFFIYFIIMSFYLNDNSISYAPSNLPSPLLVVVVVFSFSTYFIRLFIVDHYAHHHFPSFYSFYSLFVISILPSSSEMGVLAYEHDYSTSSGWWTIWKALWVLLIYALKSIKKTMNKRQILTPFFISHLNPFLYFHLNVTRSIHTVII